MQKYGIVLREDNGEYLLYNFNRELNGAWGVASRHDTKIPCSNRSYALFDTPEVAEEQAKKWRNMAPHIMYTVEEFSKDKALSEKKLRKVRK